MAQDDRSYESRTTFVIAFILCNVSFIEKNSGKLQPLRKDGFSMTQQPLTWLCYIIIHLFIIPIVVVFETRLGIRWCLVMGNSQWSLQDCGTWSKRLHWHNRLNSFVVSSNSILCYHNLRVFNWLNSKLATVTVVSDFEVSCPYLVYFQFRRAFSSPSQ